jgi:hypothetical protein
VHIAGALLRDSTASAPAAQGEYEPELGPVAACRQGEKARIPLTATRLLGFGDPAEASGRERARSIVCFRPTSSGGGAPAPGEDGVVTGPSGAPVGASVVNYSDLVVIPAISTHFRGREGHWAWLLSLRAGYRWPAMTDLGAGHHAVAARPQGVPEGAGGHGRKVRIPRRGGPATSQRMHR